MLKTSVSTGEMEGVTHCISYFHVSGTKWPDRRKVMEERFIWLLASEGSVIMVGKLCGVHGKGA